jgi:hypothetical protein
MYGDSDGGLFVDPFAGVGTAPIVAVGRGYEARGYDISPMAVLISQAKCGTFEIPSLDQALSQINIVDFTDSIEQYYLNKSFEEEIVRELLGLRTSIDSIETTPQVRKFLTLCLLHITDKFADVKKDGGFLRYFEREKPENILEFFLTTARSFANDVEEAPMVKTPQFEIADSRSIGLQDGSVDSVITSPPYLNRYDYTRIYSLELAMMGLSDEEVRKIRKDTIKSHVEARHRVFPELKSKIFDEINAEIPNRELSNPQIPNMISGYFHDMAWNINEISNSLKPGGFACYVVGNCRFSGIHVEVDSILGQIGESVGLHVEDILIAKTRGSSAQQVKKYGDQPLRESIVVFRK